MEQAFLTNDPHGQNVVAVTAFLDEHSGHDTRAAGCAAFIAKPYRHGELQAVIAVALKR